MPCREVRVTAALRIFNEESCLVHGNVLQEAFILEHGRDEERMLLHLLDFVLVLVVSKAKLGDRIDEPFEALLLGRNMEPKPACGISRISATLLHPVRDRLQGGDASRRDL
jgi:hypothetical protein